MKNIHAAFLTTALLAGACAEDPSYVEGPAPLDFDPAGVDPDAPPITVLLDLPVRLETTKEAEDRADLAADLGIDVPYVARNDLDLSVEWTLTNLDPDGDVRVEVFANGANEYFNYVPSAFIIDPEEDEAPPNLIEGIPVDVPADGTLSGVFREDQLREAAFDLDLITRGGLNPFAAILNNDEDRTSFDTIDGLTVPGQAIPSLVRFELGLTANRPVRLDFALRIRDRRGILHDELSNAPAGELVVFAPADFAPPAVMP